MSTEIWKDICEDYVVYTLNNLYSRKVYHIKPIYEVSNTGKIRNKYTKKPIAIREHNYVTLSISDFPSYCNNRYDFNLNRILYSTFVGNLTNETRVTKEMLKNI